MAEQSSADFRGTLGRYALFGEIAAGGMATVHLGRLLGSVGFSRTVAIKRLHPHLAKDPDFVAMFLEEARLAARVRHPNVVATLDVVCEDNELFLVMEYVAGESLARLIRKTRDAGRRIPPPLVIGMMCSALDGLHAAHEATSERGSPLGIVHRDVSPQNIHVGADGVARVLDFGIAKATNRVVETRTDQIKGKIAYMSPEQLAKGAIDRRADVYSASVVLWEALTGMRLFKADDVPALVYSIINDEIAPPSIVVSDLPAGIDAIVMKGLDREANNRWSSAHELAVELEKVVSPTPPREIGGWVKETAGDALAWRVELVHRIESETSTSIPPPLARESPFTPEEASGVVPNGSEAESGHYELESDEDDRRETLLQPEAAAPMSLRSIEVRAKTRRSRVGVIVAVVLLLAAGGLLAMRLVQLQQDPGASTTPTPSAEGSNELAIVLAGASRSAAPKASAPPTATTPPAVSTQPPIVRPPAPVNDCDTPFTVDSKGGRHPKPHCFKR